MPTLDELKKMYQYHKKNEFDFRNDWYMSSDSDKDFYNWRMHFSTGESEHSDISEAHWGCCLVRLVRDI